MTHDELAARLRSADHDANEAWPAMALAANRLDRYRELLERSTLWLDREWQDEAHLLALIRDAIK